MSSHTRKRKDTAVIDNGLLTLENANYDRDNAPGLPAADIFKLSPNSCQRRVAIRCIPWVSCHCKRCNGYGICLENWENLVFLHPPQMAPPTGINQISRQMPQQNYLYLIEITILISYLKVSLWHMSGDGTSGICTTAPPMNIFFWKLFPFIWKVEESATEIPFAYFYTQKGLQAQLIWSLYWLGENFYGTPKTITKWWRPHILEIQVAAVLKWSRVPKQLLVSLIIPRWRFKNIYNSSLYISGERRKLPSKRGIKWAGPLFGGHYLPSPCMCQSKCHRMLHSLHV